MASLKSLDVRLGVTNLGGFKSSLAQGAGAVDDFGRKVDRGVDGAGKKLDTLSGRSKAAAAGLAGAFVGVGLYQGIKKLVTGIGSIGVAYEDSLNTFRAVSGANVEQMGAVAGAAKALGNDLTLPGTSAAGAATALTELAKAGLSVDQALAAGKGTLQLAAAGALDEASAATIAANALNAFGLSGDKAASVANVLANAANVSSGEVTDFASGLTQVSAVARGAGLSLEETTGALALFANQGLAGSDAGTSLKTALLRLQAPTAEAASTLKAVGLNTRDASGEMLPFRDLVANLQSSMGGLSAEQRDQAMATIFGQDAIRAASILFREGVGEVDRYTAGVSRAGGAAEVAAAKSQGLGGALRGLQSQLETYAIAIYERAAPGTAALVSGLSSGLPGALASAGAALAVAAPLFDALGDVGGDLAKIVFTLAEAFLPLGRALATVAVVAVVTFLTALTVALSSVTDFMADNQAAVLVLAAVYVGTLGPALAATIASNRAMIGQKVVAFFTAMTVGAKAAGVALAGLATASGIATAGITLGAGAALLLHQRNQNIVRSAQEAAQALRSAADPGSAKSFAEYAAGVDKARIALQQQAQAAQGGYQSGLKLTKNSREAQAAYIASAEALIRLNAESHTTTTVVDAVATSFGITKDAALALAVSAGVDMTGSMTEAHSALSQAALGAKKVELSAGNLALAQQHLGDETATAAQKTDALSTALQRLVGDNLSAEDAADNVAEANIRLAESFKENGKGVTGNSQAALANRDALRGLAEAGIAQIKTLADQGVSQEKLGPIMQGTIDKFRATSGAAGLLPPQINALVKQYGLVPGTVQTIIGETGSVAAKKRVDDLKRSIDSLRNRTVVVNTIQTQSGLTAKLDRLVRASGGPVPGVGDSDSVPAVLTPGEYVIRKPAARVIGLANLHRLNAMGYAAGGHVAPAGVVARAMPVVSVAAGGVGRDPDLVAALRDLRRLAPVVGSLTVQHNSERASARQIVDEGFFAARVAGMGRRG